MSEPGSAPRSRLRGPWWFASQRHLTDEQRSSIFAQLFYEGKDRAPFLRRFAALLAFATLVAVFGLASDSGAVVIGAMLISPLTTPIMGLAAALVLAWPRRQLDALVLLAVASFAAIGLAWLALKALPEPRVVTLASEELLARTEPKLLDLAVAIVAGAAGAFVLVKREAVGALPGVAIAVALVPPLATVGMMLELGEAGKAAEAALLYVTNLAGIVLAAGVVLLVLGVNPRDAEGKISRGARLGVAVAAAAVLAITVPLAVLTAQRVGDTVEFDDAGQVIRDWADERELRVTDVDVEESQVKAALIGPKAPTGVDELAADLSSELDRDVDLQIGWTREHGYEATASG